jgi:hypothetical protein
VTAHCGYGTGERTKKSLAFNTRIKRSPLSISTLKV